MYTELFLKTIWPAFCQKLKTDDSRNNYKYILDDFMRFTGMSFELCDASQAKAYDEYLVKLEVSEGETRIKHSTHVARISCLRSIADFILKCNFVPGYDNPFNHIVVKGVEQTIEYQDMPTIEDMEILFQASKNTPMDFLIFLLAGKCGLSTSQICSLKMTDLTMNEDNKLSGLTIRKGKYSHVILLPDDVLSALHTYLNTKEPSESLFVNKRHNPLSERDLQRMLKKYLSSLGDRLYKKNFTISELRHAAVKYMKIGGATDSEIADYTGIATPNMYQRYNKISSDEMDRAVTYSVLSVNN